MFVDRSHQIFLPQIVDNFSLDLRIIIEKIQNSSEDFREKVFDKIREERSLQFSLFVGNIPSCFGPGI